MVTKFKFNVAGFKSIKGKIHLQTANCIYVLKIALLLQDYMKQNWHTFENFGRFMFNNKDRIYKLNLNTKLLVRRETTGFIHFSITP